MLQSYTPEKEMIYMINDILLSWQRLLPRERGIIQKLIITKGEHVGLG